MRFEDSAIISVKSVKPEYIEYHLLSHMQFANLHRMMDHVFFSRLCETDGKRYRMFFQVRQTLVMGIIKNELDNLCCLSQVHWITGSVWRHKRRWRKCLAIHLEIPAMSAEGLTIAGSDHDVYYQTAIRHFWSSEVIGSLTY